MANINTGTKLYMVYDKVTQSRIGHPVPAVNVEHAKRIFTDVLPNTELEKHPNDYIVQEVVIDEKCWINAFEISSLIKPFRVSAEVNVVSKKRKKGSSNA